MSNVFIVSLNSIPFLPYIYGLLKATAETESEIIQNYRFQEPIFIMDSPDKIAREIKNPQVVGFSCYVWNFRRHMKIAKLIKKNSPETLIVAGGPHIPNRVEDFFYHHPYIDILVHGEGELIFRELLKENLNSRPDWSAIAGISYQTSDGQTISTPRPASRWTEMPSAYSSGYLTSSIEFCLSKNLPFYALWETNRGCPHSCSFCDWGSNTMSKIRQFSDEQIHKDIEYFGKNKVSNLFICDANFGIFQRDLEICHKIVGTNLNYGYPKQVRVNYAKNSNDRVFEISQLFADNNMQMGTTLSMQSMSMNVLEAIDRKNITVKNYETLNERYSSEGIHTYTELILGLPLETKDSFINGLDELLSSGSHNDLRVFDFMILPNAPINEVSLRERYGLRLTSKPLYFEKTPLPEDEVERADFVFETDSLSREEWVECAVFSQIIQILHNGCYTRYLSIHLYQKYQIRYREFYERIITFARCQPETVLGKIVNRLTELYDDYTQKGSEAPYTHLIYSQEDMVETLVPFGNRRGWTPDNWGWLSIALEHERFYAEIWDFLKTFDVCFGCEIEDLIRYQSDIILQIEYDPQKGKIRRYEYDFPNYFSDKGDLRKRPTEICFRDTHLGHNYQYEIECNNLRKFAKAAIGVSYPFVRVNHYQHHMGKALISYDSCYEMKA